MHYIIGDIHGDNEGLQILLDSLAEVVQPEDELIFLGDYIDRGPDSKDVIDTLLSCHYKYPCHFIRGNHEAMFLDYLDRPYQFLSSWNISGNGGNATAKSYGFNQAHHSTAIHKENLPPSHYDFLSTQLLPYVVIAENVLCTHAGANVGGATNVEEVIANSSSTYFEWDRESPLQPNTFGTLIVGHSPTVSRQVEVWNEQNGIPSAIRMDTGPFYPLAALCWESGEILYSNGHKSNLNDTPHCP